MIKTLQTNHGTITLPTFFPDGTLGVVRGVDARDLENAKVDGLVINAYHLLTNSVSERLSKFKGIHELMCWKGPIITDSGGFQVMSLIHKNPEFGKITDDGVTFKMPGGSKVSLTPEKAIQVQLELGADIAICLDDCTKPDMCLKDQEISVERTIAWARRCKEKFRIQNSELRIKGKKKPLLFAVVQGGTNKKLRKHCATELIKIGFDGYCFGGFPVDKNGKFLSEIIKYVAKLLPDDKPKYAMGIGRPENIVECFKMGYQIFDCVIPTREARHKKLYILDENNLYSIVNIGSGKYQDDPAPICKSCDCYTCQNYSRAYLHHLFKVGDSLSVRLATIHNLRFYSMLLASLRD